MNNYNNDDIFNQSDDDLFDDTKDKAKAFHDHLKDAHGINIDFSDIEDFSSMDNASRAKIFVALNEASGTFTSHANNSAFTQASHLLLDQLSSGLYSKIHYYYLLEGKIIQRKVILKLLVSLTETDNQDLAFMRDTFKVNIDDFFINIYIRHLISMMQWSLDAQLKIYCALANDLGLQIEPTILDQDEFQDLALIQRRTLLQSVNTYVNEEYISNVLEKYNSQKS